MTAACLAIQSALINKEKRPMGTSVGVGYSVRRNPAEAGKEAALKALEQAKIETPDFLFVFASVGYNQQALIRTIRETTANVPLSGCSGEGIITQGVADETNFGVAVIWLSVLTNLGSIMPILKNWARVPIGPV